MPLINLFIPCSEFNAYLQQIKIIFSAVKKISYFFTGDEYDFIFVFTVANRGCFDNLGLTFFQKRSEMHRSCLTLCRLAASLIMNFHPIVKNK